MRYNRFIAIFAALLMLGLASCTDNSPKAVAEKFLNAFYHKDYEKARSVSTEKTIELVNLMEQFSIQQPDSVKQNAKLIKIEIVDVKEEGDKATVIYTASNEPGEQKLRLEKQNGKWLVSHSKQDDLDEEPSEEGILEGDATEM
ncbi:MAG: DUF4878 domain-containing protein [Chitinophagaceae bacterium]|nr:DUF4878 domain-containing protein [Chitinophagaceae bacterium]MCB9045076.1 DUF4878 domain-containing protein [Chitinophagales bacterium]